MILVLLQVLPHLEEVMSFYTLSQNKRYYNNQHGFLSLCRVTSAL